MKTFTFKGDSGLNIYKNQISSVLMIILFFSQDNIEKDFLIMLSYQVKDEKGFNQFLIFSKRNSKSRRNFFKSQFQSDEI